MTDPMIAALAGKLTKPQVNLLLEAPATASKSYAPANKLEALGLAAWREGRFGDSFHILPLGKLVAHHLRTQTEGGESDA